MVNSAFLPICLRRISTNSVTANLHCCEYVHLIHSLIVLFLHDELQFFFHMNDIYWHVVLLKE